MSTSTSSVRPSAAAPTPDAAATSTRPSKVGGARNRLVALDGLRFLAALMVVFYHYIGQGSFAWQHNTSQLFPTLHLPASYGFFGVELFFLISGFVICMSSWNRTLGEFFVSRAVRLYPAYWLAVIASSVILALWPVIAKPLAPGQVLVNLTMFHSAMGVANVDQVYWTLWVEMRFYLLFAIVVWRGVNYRRVVLFCVLWTVGSLLAASSQEQTLQVIFQPEYSPYFIAGVVMYLMYRFRANMLLWAILAVCWLFAQDRIIARLHETDTYVGRHLHWWPASLLITVFFLLVLAVARGWLSWVRGGWITVLGTMTYPLYLLHEVAGWTAIRVLHTKVPTRTLLIGTILAMMLLAWLVHMLVERPLAPVLKRGLLRGLTEIRAEAMRRPSSATVVEKAPAGDGPTEKARAETWPETRAQPRPIDQ